MKSSTETPLMRQYRTVKERFPDAVLLFRLGDFYETFGQDAVETSKACGITLTKRNNGSAGDIPLAGFPHHQLDAYLPKLVRAGHRVAVCEQLEDPKQAKGIVKRDVVEVVTPGVVLYDKLLEHKSNTYLAALVPPTPSNSMCGLAVADVSTGSFSIVDVPEPRLVSMLESFQPAEILVPKDAREWWDGVYRSLPNKPAITRIEPWLFESSFAEQTLLRHFNTHSLKGFGLDSVTPSMCAAGAIVHYVQETQRGALAQLTGLRVLRAEEAMVLDTATRRNLEIHAAMSGEVRQGALVDVVDHTVTAMGGRLLRWWLHTPLVNRSDIEARLAIVRGCVQDTARTTSMRNILERMVDIERLITKVVTNRASARDLAGLRGTLMLLPELKAQLLESPFPELRAVGEQLVLHEDLCAHLLRALVDEPPATVGTGTMFRAGFDNQLDDAANAMLHGKEWIRDYQDRERSATGISSLKVSYTSVFGYYIEVPNTHKARVPEYFTRRQTLANAERYVTLELKEYEQKILTAEHTVTTLESGLLEQLRQRVAADCKEVQRTAAVIAQLDVLAGFANVAKTSGYCEPRIHDGTELQITNARHPVIERILPAGVRYTPNSVRMDTSTEQIQILTGPNMSGKSSYLRQVGLIVFLAHVGSFVPATEAMIPLTDRIFTRVGAQDNIMAGESTFLVEMQEAANILNNATDRSLILLDEVGRGTATFDGISIAWAIAEYLHQKIRAKTIFATHYHELTALSDSFQRIKNMQVEVVEHGADIVFTHRVIPGHTDHSFGIHVARMAGLPPSVIASANVMLKRLEEGHPQASVMPLASAGQISLFEVRDDELRSRLNSINVNELTPVAALTLLAELKESLDEQ